MNEQDSYIQKSQLASAFLRAIVQANSAIYGALISTTDGHPVKSLFKKQLSASRIAAMTSSCLALSERLAKESEQNGCNFVILQNDNGYIAIKRINPTQVVTVFSSDESTLGILLSGVNNAVLKYLEQL